MTEQRPLDIVGRHRDRNRGRTTGGQAIKDRHTSRKARTLLAAARGMGTLCRRSRRRSAVPSPPTGAVVPTVVNFSTPGTHSWTVPC